MAWEMQKEPHAGVNWRWQCSRFSGGWPGLAVGLVVARSLLLLLRCALLLLASSIRKDQEARLKPCF